MDHVLDWETKRQVAGARFHGDGLQVLQQARRFSPRHSRTPPHNVVACYCADWNEVDRTIAKRFCKQSKLVLNSLEYLLSESHEIHLIYRHHDAFESQEPEDIGVPASLREHPFACVQQKNR